MTASKDNAMPNKQPNSPAEALQCILDVSAFIMEYGRVETGTPESGKLLAAYGFLAKHHGVDGQSGNIRKNPTFFFMPVD